MKTLSLILMLHRSTQALQWSQQRNHALIPKRRELRDADETQQQATLSSLSRFDKANTMQSHSKDTTQQATFPNLQSGSHDSAVELFLSAFSELVPIDTTQTERNRMTELHSLYFTKRAPDRTSFSPSPQNILLCCINPESPLISLLFRS
jgi:hypothetical protein